MLELLRKARVTTGSNALQLDTRRKAIEDMLWAMLSSKEFLFNY